MNNVILKQPQRIVFGTGSLARFADDFLALEKKRLFVLTAEPVLPALSSTLDRLRQAGIEVQTETRIAGEPTVGDFKR
ncbi:MAG: iron-containing alcohol dehydrogenase, partial [Bacteroidales bacterium]|nr:iron-containing alcohol dehydrogenase [Bacteroidales bacterium]